MMIVQASDLTAHESSFFERRSRISSPIFLLHCSFPHSRLLLSSFSALGHDVVTYDMLLFMTTRYSLDLSQIISSFSIVCSEEEDVSAYFSPLQVIRKAGRDKRSVHQRFVGADRLSSSTLKQEKWDYNGDLIDTLVNDIYCPELRALGLILPGETYARCSDD